MSRPRAGTKVLKFRCERTGAVIVSIGRVMQKLKDFDHSRTHIFQTPLHNGSSVGLRIRERSGNGHSGGKSATDSGGVSGSQSGGVSADCLH